jgi:hypothetical protein
MKLEVREVIRQGAIQAVGLWVARGCEYASMVDGMPRPWSPKSFKLISADAEQRGVELLSLANGDHVKSILAAIFEYVQQSLIASQAEAELRKLRMSNAQVVKHPDNVVVAPLYSNDAVGVPSTGTIPFATGPALGSLHVATNCRRRRYAD